MVLSLVTLTDLQTRRAGLSASAELLVMLGKILIITLQCNWQPKGRPLFRDFHSWSLCFQSI